MLKIIGEILSKNLSNISNVCIKAAVAIAQIRLKILISSKNILMTSAKVIRVNMMAFLIFFLTSSFFNSINGEELQKEEDEQNKWQKIYHDRIDKNGKGKFLGSKLIWSPDENCFTLLVNSNKVLFRFDVKENTFKKVKLNLEEDLRFDKWESPFSACYVDSLKKIFYMRREFSYTDKGPVNGWFVDLKKEFISPIRASVAWKSMDLSKYNPLKKGLPLPVWSAVCYDSFNDEVVSFGGACVWGSVDEKETTLSVGDWVYDQEKKLAKRINTIAETKEQGYRYYPGQAGTLLFSIKENKWYQTKQELKNQPKSRILAGTVYANKNKKIYLFGGDDLSKCFNDLWEYDCVTKSWKLIKVENAPPARAAMCMMYHEKKNAILVAGGYGGGWNGLQDVWIYQIDEGKWRCVGDVYQKNGDKDFEMVGSPLPKESMVASGSWIETQNRGVLFCYQKIEHNSDISIYSITEEIFDLVAIEPAPPKKNGEYHSVAWNSYKRSYLPEDSILPELSQAEIDDRENYLKNLPGNVWVKQELKRETPARGWGSFVYDIEKHMGFAWGGGHSAYPGAELSEYSLLHNSWRCMSEAANYNPLWLHGMVNGPPGVSFGGWSLLPSHARKSYGFDPVSKKLVTLGDDVYDPEHHLFVSHMQEYPVAWRGPSYQASYVTASHGLYSFSVENKRNGKGWLCKANVEEGRWDVVTKEGPGGHSEYDFLAYDSLRDRVIHFRKNGGGVSYYLFQSNEWGKELVSGDQPNILYGDATYIPSLDSVLLVFGDKEEKMYFYHCEKKKWYVSNYVGDKAYIGNSTSKNFSPIYDPKYNIIVRIYNEGIKGVAVNLLRLDTSKLVMKPYVAEKE